MGAVCCSREGSIQDPINLGMGVSTICSSKGTNIFKDQQFLETPLYKPNCIEVRKAINKITQQPRGIMIINKREITSDDCEKLKNQLQVLIRIDHPHILKIFEFYENESNIYLVEELLTGKELFDKILKQKQFNERHAIQIMKQILCGVTYCHSNLILHGDLKPENLVYDSMKEDAPLKVINFGLAWLYNAIQKRRYGTAFYVAPEVLNDEFSAKSDIWACGVILQILLAGYPPFKGPTEKSILEQVSQAKLSMDGPEWQKLSDSAKDLIMKMLEKDPRKRYSAADVNNHPWMCNTEQTSHNQTNMLNALSNLESFQTQNKFQEAMLTIFVTHLTSKEEKNQLLNLFKELDTNNDGQLTKDDLLKGYAKFVNDGDNTDIVNKIFQNIDANGNGSIDYNEFVMATINKKTLFSKERMKQAFKLIDKDGDGSIQKEELVKFFGSLPDFTEAMIVDLMTSVANKEILSQEDFQNIMNNLLGQEEKTLKIMARKKTVTEEKKKEIEHVMNNNKKQNKDKNIPKIVITEAKENEENKDTAEEENGKREIKKRKTNPSPS